MNKRIFQLCMIWLLAFSVPLQGIAAVAKTCCWKMPLPLSAAVASSSAHDNCHEDEAMLVTSHATLTPTKPPSHAAGHVPCKACAHCAFGAMGVLPYIPTMAFDFTAPAPMFAVPASFVNHINPRLDRPPKALDFFPKFPQSND